jgi:NAD(P)-dependent dehydrogenase (short-subunit alcohol dehydrogenase family)
MTVNTAKTQPAFDLSGRIVLVTGASSGLGAHFAQIYAAAGARVALAARRVDRLEAGVAAIQAAGGHAIAVEMDVESEASVIAGYDAIEAAFGAAPSSVVANAGINLEGMAVDIDMAAFDQIMNVNVRGVFITAREGARRMIAAGSAKTGVGRVILIASLGATKVLPGLVTYCTSKAAVAMMGKALAREWANKGVSVNTLCPGYVETELNGEWLNSEGGQRMIKGFARRRLMRETDLDAAALWLASDAAQFVTGSTFGIDDGQGL